jgi:hypothetical protein
MKQLRIVTLRGFGWDIAHAAVTRRPPVSLHTVVPRTGGYAYAVGVWAVSIIQGPFSVAPCQTHKRFHTTRFFFAFFVAIGGYMAPTAYSDEKVANRDTKVWHFVIENGY